MAIAVVFLTFILLYGTTTNGETGEDLLEDDGTVLEADETAQHISMENSWARLFEAKDAQSFADRYARDAVWLRCTNSILRGREEVRQGYEDWFEIADRQDECTNLVNDDLSDDYMIVSASCNMYRDDSATPIEKNRYIAFNQRVEGGFQIFFQMNIEDKYDLVFLD